MNLFELTRTLIDIESITGNELAVGEYLVEYLGTLAERYHGQVERMPVELNRFNVLARFGDSKVTLTTHLDTVPPFFLSREDDNVIHGRGACDVKGIIACMIKAAEGLLAAGTRDFGLLFVVGEERNSAGAYAAAREPRGSKFLINGEPTENHLALGSKGALRYEAVASGRMAHSAYPELGESAIEKLLVALDRVRAIALPTDELLGPGTLNIGMLSGGRAPNVIADHATASIMFRLVSDAEPLRQAVENACHGLVELHEYVCIPAVRLGSLSGLPTTVVAFTTDIPAFGDAWGEPFLIGPGSIHVAHTEREYVPKRQLLEAVDIYSSMVRRLQVEGRGAVNAGQFN